MKRWIAGVIVLWLLVTMVLVWVTKGNATEASQWGDAFGAVIALFSGLAFVVVLFTLRSQEKQLKEQQEEIKKQNETLSRQQFEATFFHMLKMFDEHRRSIKFGGAEGLAALRIFRTNAGQRLRDQLGAHNFHVLMQEQQYEEGLGPYLRQYHNLCSLVESANLDDKRVYWHLTRDFLTGPEAVLILFHCNSSYQYSKLLKAIIEKHGLLYGIKADGSADLSLREGWASTAFEAF